MQRLKLDIRACEAERDALESGVAAAHARLAAAGVGLEGGLVDAQVRVGSTASLAGSVGRVADLGSACRAFLAATWTFLRSEPTASTSVVSMPPHSENNSPSSASA